MKVGDLIDVKIWKTPSFRARFGVGMIIDTKKDRHPMVGNQWVDYHTVFFGKNGVTKYFCAEDLAPLGYWIW
jgi:hypothetical protein